VPSKKKKGESRRKKKEFPEYLTKSRRGRMAGRRGKTCQKKSEKPSTETDRRRGLARLQYQKRKVDAAQESFFHVGQKGENDWIFFPIK